MKDFLNVLFEGSVDGRKKGWQIRTILERGSCEGFDISLLYLSLYACSSH